MPIKTPPNGFEYRSLSSEDEIRFLYLNPAKSSEPVTARLLHSPLSSAPAFSALSYAWVLEPDYDDPDEYDAHKLTPCIISIQDENDEVFNVTVTHNLWLALAHLSQFYHGPLWVDQLCVNQSDEYEKSFQVHRMDLVYTQAVQTYLWLGPSNEMRAWGMAQIHWLGEFLHNSGFNGRDNVNFEEAQIFNHYDDPSSLLNGIYGVIRQKWWARVWVIQEVLLSHDPILICGNDSVRFNAVVLTLFFLDQLITRIDAESRPDLYQTTEAILLRASHFIVLLQDMLSVDAAEKRLPLWRIQAIARTAPGLDASDERDRYWGMLGLVKPEHRKFVQVDYGEGVKMHAVEYNIDWAIRQAGW
ncbi:heterokaryon incompatibility protein-domain-containing protein [Aspergillus alliaceus]|uniref:Heterokaryon incompatibility protein-domain-containing protein n=1 Tax=Petromyces alliaceus TaxID=209559 RepID=A0A5N7BVK3_PETAA|nr:heterokaryon incompatibility protein-domain-containing protein [Aspergillus alliaceus]